MADHLDDQQLDEFRFYLVSEFGHSNSTLFVIAKHPSAKGATNEYFHQVGRMVAKNLHAAKPGIRHSVCTVIDSDSNTHA